MAQALAEGKTRVIDIDLRADFATVRHAELWEKVARRVADDEILHLLALILKASGKRGVPQGGVISPVLSNLYLTEVERMLERAQATTREGQYTFVEYARYADDLGILVDACQRHDWLLRAVEKRLREEVAKLGVESNEEKSRLVELAQGESCGFLGCDFRRIRSRRGVWRPHYPPKLKRRTAVVRKLKEVFRRGHSQPVARIVKVITPILRGGVNYFRIGYSGPCFDFIRQWVEKKIRRHVRRAKKRPGFGWQRRSLRGVYEELGLFTDYRIHRPPLLQKALRGREVT